jgi:hypothetical protein
MNAIKQIPLKWKILISISIILTIVVGVMIYKKRKESGEITTALGLFNRAPSIPDSATNPIESATTIGTPPSSTTSFRDPRPLVNQIYENLDGMNLFQYPEIVNKLANLSVEELTYAYDYFNEEYGGVTGKTLYEFIEAEWGEGVYDPALERLERHNLT